MSTYRIRRVKNTWRVELNAGRGQIMPLASFLDRRDAERYLAKMGAGR